MESLEFLARKETSESVKLEEMVYQELLDHLEKAYKDLLVHQASAYKDNLEEMEFKETKETPEKLEQREPLEFLA